MNGKRQVQEFYGSSVFSKYGLIALPSILILSFIYGFKELIWITLSCFVILLFARSWAASSVKDLEIAESISAREVFPNEETHLEFKVQNNKRLPVAWLNLETGDFKKANDESAEENYLNTNKEQEDGLIKIGWISGKESLSVKKSFKLSRRGRYKVGTSLIRSGDPFSLFCCEQTYASLTTILVYPTLLDFPWPDFGRKYPNGNITDQNVVFTDPVFKVGLKDYEPSDSLKNINWAASARYQALKANIAEGKAVSRCFLFLDAVNLLQKNWPKEKKELAWELLVSGVASLAFNLTSNDKEWSFATNFHQNTKQDQVFETQSNTTSSHHQLRLLLARLACLDIRTGNIASDNQLLRVKGQSGVTLIIFSVSYDYGLEARLLQTTQFKQIKWFILEEDCNSKGSDAYLLKPRWSNDDNLYKQFIG